MSIFQAIILGIIEGLTEFLPISSTAHITLFAKLLLIPNDDFFKAFTYIIQGGTILSLTFVFTKQLLSKPILILKLFVAFLPTAIAGLILKNILFDQLLDDSLLTIIMLFIIGVVMLFWDKLPLLNQSKFTTLESVPYKILFLIGLAQSLAIVPGISRAAITIVTALALGLDKPTSIKWSFLLALPTLLGATVISLVDIQPQLLIINLNQLLFGTISAMISGIIVLILFQKHARQLSWKIYGFYRILFAIITFILIF